MLDDVLAILGIPNNLYRWRLFVCIFGALLALLIVHFTISTYIDSAVIFPTLGLGVVLGTTWEYAASRRWSLKEGISVALVSLAPTVIAGGIFTTAFFYITDGPLEYSRLIGSTVGLLLFLFTMQKFGG